MNDGRVDSSSGITGEDEALRHEDYIKCRRLETAGVNNLM